MYFLSYLFEIVLFILLVWAGLFLLNLVHEGGHVLMYRIFFRDGHWHITIGTGRVIVRLKRFTLALLPIKGNFNTAPDHEGTKLQYIMMCLGGPMANVVFLVLVFFASGVLKANFDLPPGLDWFLGLFFWGNIFQLFVTVLPLEYTFGPYAGEISDGMRIKRIRETSKKLNN